MGFEIRFAREEDCETILSFIRMLAVYEKLEHEVTATSEGLRKTLFAEKRAEVILGEEDGVPVAFALFFHNYSTFLGQANLYLEDLLVQEDRRGRGYGKAMLKKLAEIACLRQCRRLDWWCLDWNGKSIEFYERMGAAAKSEWTVYRLEGDALRAAGASHP